MFLFLHDGPVDLPVVELVVLVRLLLSRVLSARMLLARALLAPTGIVAKKRDPGILDPELFFGPN